MLITKIVLCVSMLTLGVAQASEEKPQPQAEHKVAPKVEQVKQTTKVGKAEAGDKAEPEEKLVDGVKLRAIEAHVVSYTNQERARYGLPPLQVDSDLMDTAREHAAWMTRNRSMVHTSQPVAENIAMGQPDSSDVVQAWMNSPGHRANILNSGHRHIGVAAFRTASGTIFWCQQFRP
jgi:uncharacterized protein YkwD